MEDQFDLIMPNPPKALLIVLLGTVAVLGAATGVGNALAALGDGVALGGAGLMVLAGGYGVFRLLKSQASDPLTVNVRPDALHLHWPKTGLDKTISFSQIESYRVERYKGNEELRLRLNDTTKLRIVVNPDLYGGPHLTELERCFEERLRAYPRPAGAPPTLREKKALAGTAALVAVAVLAIMVLALPVLAFVANKRMPPGVILPYIGVVGGTIFYAVAVYRARQEGPRQ